MLLTSPFAPHFAEEVFEHYRKISTKDQRHFSVFQLGWPETPAEWVNEDILKDWDSMRKMRDLVNVELERIRQEK